MFHGHNAFIILPLQDHTNAQETSKNHATRSPNTDSGIQSPSTPTNGDHNRRNFTKLDNLLLHRQKNIDAYLDSSLRDLETKVCKV